MVGKTIFKRTHKHNLTLICFTYKKLIHTHYRLFIVDIRKGVCLNSSWVSIQI